jgi:hypothetical protein
MVDEQQLKALTKINMLDKLLSALCGTCVLSGVHIEPV